MEIANKLVIFKVSKEGFKRPESIQKRKLQRFFKLYLLTTVFTFIQRMEYTPK